MIVTFAITIFIESSIVAGYAIWRNKPLKPLLLSCIFVNLVTQTILWVLLNLLFRHYLATLFIAEIFIWWTEGITLYLYRYNRLGRGEAMALSLAMNLTSFIIGWVLPV